MKKNASTQDRAPVKSAWDLCKYQVLGLTAALLAGEFGAMGGIFAEAIDKPPIAVYGALVAVVNFSIAAYFALDIRRTLKPIAGQSTKFAAKGPHPG